MLQIRLLTVVLIHIENSLSWLVCCLYQNRSQETCKNTLFCATQYLHVVSITKMAISTCGTASTAQPLQPGRDDVSESVESRGRAEPYYGPYCVERTAEAFGCGAAMGVFE